MKTTGVSVCVTLPWLIDLYLTYVCISAVLVVGQYHKLEMEGLHWPEKTHIVGEKEGLTFKNQMFLFTFRFCPTL